MGHHEGLSFKLKPNLQIMGIEEKEYHDESTENISSKFKEYTFSNLEKEMSIWAQEAYRPPNR